MASRPISIEFVADVSNYLREVKKVEVSTDDIADALVAASNDAQDLERKMSRAMRDAEKDVEGLERVIKDLPKATDRAADEARKDFDRIGDSADDAGRDAGKNFMGNLGEGLSSGDLSDTLQDTLGELVAEIEGPGSAAIAAGAALALVLWNAFAANEEAKKNARDSIFAAFDEVTGELDKREAVKAGIEELGGGDFAQGLLDAKNYAEALNISTAEYGELVSGQVNPRTRQTVQNLQDLVKQLETQKQLQDGVLTPAQEKQLDAAKQTLGTTKLQQEALAGAAQAQQFWTDTQAATGANAEEIRQSLEDAVSEAAEIGTGNDELDALLDKAEELGWELLSDEEKAKLIGSGNPHVAAIRDRARELEKALDASKDYLDNFPDPSMASAVAASRSIRDAMQAAAIAAGKLPGVKTTGSSSVNVSSGQQGSAPINPFVPKTY